MIHRSRRRHDLIAWPWAMILACALLVGCQEDNSNARPNGTYQVVATVGMITDIVRNVAGDRASVSGLIGEGVDPHLYKPTRNDVVKLGKADVVFYNGLLLEGKMTEVLAKLASADKPVVAVADTLLARDDYVMNKDDGSGHTDPHVWMDVQGWSAAVRVVEQTLVDYDPGHAQTYHDNAEAYLAKLAELDAYARATFATIPKGKRVLVTAHDAFRYLGRAYGIEVRGIQGLSTESEAGLADIENLVTFLATRNIPAVFVESSVADKNVRALVEGAKARGHQVAIGGELFSDAMGQTGTYEGTYVGMIDHNVTTITRALGGKAPAKGWQGKLKNPSPH